MTWLVVDKDGAEIITSGDDPPKKQKHWSENIWHISHYNEVFELPKGSIERLIGRKLTWDNEPVEYEGD
jgi:hypothetical protein